MPRIVAPTSSVIARAAEILRADGVVAFPTETVYGLGALTLSDAGLQRVYQLKGRPKNNPLIAHVLNAAQARMLIAAGAWDDRCERLAARFWPGPLTLVLPRNDRVPSRAAAGLPSIAVRSPAHAVARALIEAVGDWLGCGAISAPSANRSGCVSPTTAQHVFEEFADADADAADADELLIIDGGACEVGIESTVLDLTPTLPRLLRPGAVTLEQLREALGDVEAPRIDAQGASPGTSMSHYAPRTPVELVSESELPAVLAAHALADRRCAALCFDAALVPLPHTALLMPRSAEGYAHELYRALREADALHADRIVAQMPPSSSDVWRAVHDRLRRAAAG